MQTNFGCIDGNRWEEICHKILHIKYPDYQPVPDRFGGDLGIEGFTFSGIAFQCYCPDGDGDSEKELYVKQRDKISKDVKKLMDNEKEIKNVIGSTVLREWHFLTPRYESKDLVSHCRTKEVEARKKGKEYIDSKKFSILLKDESAYALEINSLLAPGLKLDIGHKDVNPADIIDWQKAKPQLAAEIQRKIGNIIQGNEKRKNTYVDANIKAYLVGETVLSQLQKFPELFGQFLSLKSTWETKAQADSTLWESEAGAEIRDFREKYKEDLMKEIGDSVVVAQVDMLVQHAIADWLIRCPLEIYV